MRRASHSERAKFVALIQQHAGGDPAQRRRFAQGLMTSGATFRRAQENYYKGGQRKLRRFFPQLRSCAGSSIADHVSPRIRGFIQW